VVVEPCVGCEGTWCGPAPPPLNDTGPEDDMSGLAFSTTAIYTWVIKEWSKHCNRDYFHSETFSVDGHNW